MGTSGLDGGATGWRIGWRIGCGLTLFCLSFSTWLWSSIWFRRTLKILSVVVDGPKLCCTAAAVVFFCCLTAAGAGGVLVKAFCR